MKTRALVAAALFSTLASVAVPAPVEFTYKTEPFNLRALERWQNAYVRRVFNLVGVPLGTPRNVFSFSIEVDCEAASGCPREIKSEAKVGEPFGPFKITDPGVLGNNVIFFGFRADFAKRDIFEWSMTTAEFGISAGHRFSSEGDAFKFTDLLFDASRKRFYCHYTFGDELLGEIDNPTYCENGRLAQDFDLTVPYGQGRWFVDGGPIDPIPLPASLPLYGVGLVGFALWRRSSRRKHK